MNTEFKSGTDTDYLPALHNSYGDPEVHTHNDDNTEYLGST